VSNDVRRLHLHLAEASWDPHNPVDDQTSTNLFTLELGIPCALADSIELGLRYSPVVHTPQGQPSTSTLVHSSTKALGSKGAKECAPD